MIECDSVRFGYGKTKDAELIHGISLSIEDGEFVALTGENGAGKSTFSKLLASIAFLVSPMLPLPEISITQASIKHTAKVIIDQLVPLALQDCLNKALLNIFV